MNIARAGTARGKLAYEDDMFILVNQVLVKSNFAMLASKNRVPGLVRRRQLRGW